ncbi:hypothetical protein C8J56DRAFT_912760 [Mycena floridula]|nr:hypothetical protein C8J56DRAFT_912760 [Mycena floridula]
MLIRDIARKSRVRVMESWAVGEKSCKKLPKEDLWADNEPIKPLLRLMEASEEEEREGMPSGYGANLPFLSWIPLSFRCSSRYSTTHSKSWSAKQGFLSEHIVGIGGLDVDDTGQVRGLLGQKWNEGQASARRRACTGLLWDSMSDERTLVASGADLARFAYFDPRIVGNGRRSAERKGRPSERNMVQKVETISYRAQNHTFEVLEWFDPYEEA